MTYINKATGERYQSGSVAKRIDLHTVFFGVPNEEQLTQWGFEQYVKEPNVITDQEIRDQRMAEILIELREMDYLTSKYIDGEDMSEYGDWQAKRKALRKEYRQLEEAQQS